MLTTLLVWGCDDREEMESVVLKSEGAIPVITSGESTFYNLLDLDNASVDFDLGINGKAESVVIYKSFNNGDKIKLKEVSSVPATVTVTLDEAINGFGVTKDELVPGDMFSFTFEVISGGKSYHSNVVFSAAGSCPSSIPEGEFLATSGGTSTYGPAPNNPLSNHEEVVTLTAEGGGKYTISDFSAGAYRAWYSNFCGDCKNPAIITDVCNDLSFRVTDVFGCLATGTGSYDPQTGIAEMSWSNCFGDTGYWSLDTTP